MGLKLDLFYFACVLGFFLLLLWDYFIIHWFGAFIMISEPNIAIWALEFTLIIFIIGMSIYKMGGMLVKKKYGQNFM
jgi:hypothetical protein